jgi:VanZ family protein
MLKKFKKERTFYAIVTLLIALEIFLFSSIPSPIGEYVRFNLATLYHFGVFFMFTFFLTLTIRGKKIGNKTILIVLLISLFYAMSDEFHQLFVIGRFASIEDILIDFAGSLLSILTLKVIGKFNKL